jgi:hypothetical protein
MADDYKTKWEKFLQEAVREAVKEQIQDYLGYDDGEMADAEAFLAIPVTPGEDPQLTAWKWATNIPPLSSHTIRVGEAQLLGRYYHGRWDDLSYSDHAFLYDMGISLQEDSRANRS